MYIHKEGKSYVIIASILFFAISFLFYKMMDWNIFIASFLWTVFFLLYVWVWWFFRIPKRDFIFNENKIIAPCDGKVVVIEETVETEYFKDKRIQISIFMSPLNVHVNRYPISGKVEYSQYHKGKYLVAWHPKSSTENERTTVVVKNNKTEILFRQIAGAVARRICCYAKVGDLANQNDEFGFIKFGSRVDIFLPLNTQINVKIDDITYGGQTILAEF